MLIYVPVESLEIKAARASDASKSRQLILKPPGQAGRKSGYNLQEAMGLADDTERYNRQLVRLHFLLGCTLTIVC